MTGHSAGDPCIVTDPTHHLALVFGMAWTPLIGSRAVRYVRQVAARQGATHYACTAEPGLAMGVLCWPRGALRPPQGLRLVAAAAEYAARAGEGLHVDLFRLADGRYWLVGARSGVVLSRTDRLFDRDADARRVYLDVCQTAGFEHDKAHACSIPACPDLSENSPGSGSLYRLGAAERFVRRYRGRLLVGVSSLAAAFAYFWETDVPGADMHAPQEILAMSDSGLAPSVVPLQVWREALHARWQGAPAMTAVIDRFRHLPVHVGGWALSQARCTWEQAAWTCRAQYLRDDNRATNQALAETIGSDWSVSFAPVDHAFLSWRQHEAGAAVPINAWPTVPEVDLGWISTLQAIVPAFQHVSVGAPEYFELDDAGSAQPIWPDGTPRRRAIEAQGPMRSFAAWPWVPYTVWSEAALMLRESADQALTDSRVHMLIRGWVHERHHAPS